jgi:hypothetical protein
VRANPPSKPPIGPGPSGTPPHVSGLLPVRLKRKGLAAVVVNFDYHLVSVGKGKKLRLKVVGPTSASYDTASRSVRPALKKPFKTGTLRLTIDHAAALAANGMGLAGGDYVATVPG